MTDTTCRDVYDDPEGMACALDQVEAYLIRHGRYPEATTANNAATCIRELAEREADLEKALTVACEHANEWERKAALSDQPAPEQEGGVERLRADVRALVRTYSASLPAGFRAAIGMRLAEHPLSVATPAPEGEALVDHVAQALFDADDFTPDGAPFTAESPMTWRQLARAAIKALSGQPTPEQEVEGDRGELINAIREAREEIEDVRDRLPEDEVILDTIHGADQALEDCERYLFDFARPAPEQDIELADVLAWADGIHATPAELVDRVTEDEWRLAARIRGNDVPAPEQEGRLLEALTPSAATKAAYIGEFSFPIEVTDDVTMRVDVPWTTVKEIMKAIRERAALTPEADPEREDAWLLQDKRSIVGNSMSWWKKGGHGYSCDVREAERMTRERAARLVTDLGHFAAYPAAYIVGLARPHIDFQHVEPDRALTPERPGQEGGE